MLCQLRNFGFALALSTAALFALLVLQALLLFREPVARLGTPVQPRIETLAICDAGCRGLLFIREPMVLNRDRIRYTATLFRATAPAGPLPLSTGNLIPFSIAAARGAPLFFVVTTTGELYSLDLRTKYSPPVHFGAHRERFPNVLACTDDAKLVVAANDDITCWDRAAGCCRWRRDNCGLLRGSFIPGTHRFVAIRRTGRIVELDPNSGETLCELPNHCGFTLYFDVSPGDHLLAAVNAQGTCVVSALATSEPLWSRRFPLPTIAPRFSPDGRLLIASDEQRRPRLSILCAGSGHLLGELTGAPAEISGIEVSPQGAVLAWDFSGTVTVWDLASRKLLFQFRPEQFT